MDRVLQIVHGMNVGGIETFLMNVYRNIDKNKIQFDFMLNTETETFYEKEIKELGGNIYHIPSRRKGILNNRKSLNEFFKKHPEYKVVHAHVSSLTYVEPLKVAKKYKIPVRIIHSRNNNQRGKIHYVLHKINQLNVKKYATHYFAISKLAAEWLYGKKQVDRGEYQIIGNGLEIEKFDFNQEMRNLIRRELNIKSNQKVIGHVGRFDLQKNHNFLIDIFKEIVKKNKDAIMLLIGDGPLKGDIQTKVRKMGIEKNIRFLGIKKNVNEYMQAMDCFLFPSLHEGLGRVLIEAQATDLPCIATAKVIPQEAKILETYKEIPLEETAETWANETIEALKYEDRKSRKSEIKNAGYDIKEVTKYLEKFYIENSK